VEFEGKSYPISQCNNSYVFPGVGLGVVSVKARRVTPGMFMAASIELARIAEACPGSPILPPLSMIRDVSKSIAVEVGLRAIEDGVADSITRDELAFRVDANMWTPNYPEIHIETKVGVGG
jgi:malate dehydrogenase (oxaloacetate-decarboxylating)